MCEPFLLVAYLHAGRGEAVSDHIHCKELHVFIADRPEASLRLALFRPLPEITGNAAA